MIAGRDDERRATDDQRIDEEERARGATGQGDQHRRDGDRDGTLEDELGGPSALDGNRSWMTSTNTPAERQQHEDRGLALRPQAGHADDRRGRQQEHPRRDAHDAVVRAGRDAVLGVRVVVTARRRRRPRPSPAPTRMSPRSSTPSLAAHRADRRRRHEHGHDHEIRDHRDDDQGEDRLQRHTAILDRVLAKSAGASWRHPNGAVRGRPARAVIPVRPGAPSGSPTGTSA